MPDDNTMAAFVYSFCRECGIEARLENEPVVQRLIYLSQHVGVISKMWPDFDWIDDSWPNSKLLGTARATSVLNYLPACSEDLTSRIKHKLMPLFSLKPSFALLEDWIVALARLSYCAERGINPDEAIDAVLVSHVKTGPKTLSWEEHNVMLCIARDVLTDKKLLWHNLQLIVPKTDRSNLDWLIENKQG